MAAEGLNLANLAIQGRMAEAAELMIFLTWIQIGLAVIGSAALVYTLWLNRRSVNQAEATIRLTDEAMRNGQRAYVYIEFDPIGDFSPGLRPQGRVRFRNAGTTPARTVYAGVETFYLPFFGDYSGVDFDALPRERAHDIQPQTSQAWYANGPALSKDDVAWIESQQTMIQVNARIIFEDIFGDRQEVKASMHFTGPGAERRFANRWEGQFES